MSVELLIVLLAVIMIVDLVSQAKMQKTILTLRVMVEMLNQNDKSLLDGILKANEKIKKIENIKEIRYGKPITQIWHKEMGDSVVNENIKM